MKKRNGRHHNNQTTLSVERTLLSNERTLLAYIQAGFSAFLLGLGLIKLFEESFRIVYLGYISLAFGVLLIVLGIIFHTRRKMMILNGSLEEL